jgi:hypothetical protein
LTVVASFPVVLVASGLVVLLVVALIVWAVRARARPVNPEKKN